MSQAAQPMAPTGHDRPHITPSVVAMPLPPLKESHTGNMWPSTAPAAAPTAASSPSWAAISTATAPFKASSSKVAAASPLRPVRSTLVAPILPEPTLRISPNPAARVSSRPNGIEPSRYPSRNGPSRRTKVDAICYARRLTLRRRAAPSRRVGSRVRSCGSILRAHDLAVGRVDVGRGRRADQLGGDLLAGLDE